MKQKVVSIIVPVYNVEQYIDKCITSLRAQDYSNIEIILVDDGSPDKSGKICDKHAKNDGRIINVHKKNGGVSSARNTGLEIALGEYVMFVDGDDWVERNYVSYFIDLVESMDKCKIGYNKNNYYISMQTSGNNKYCISAEKAMEWIYSDEIFVAVWNKIYKTNIIKKNNIKFSEDIWYGEGMLFNIECLQCVDNVAIGEKSVYHQTFNPDSAMRSFNLANNFCGISSMWLQKAHWKKNSKEIEREWQFHRYRFNRTIIDGLVRSNVMDNNQKVFHECVCNLRKGILLPLKLEKTLKRKLGWICYFVFPVVMARRAAKKFKLNLQKTDAVQ